MRRRNSERPTIRDVAREAGVGIGTASRVLNEDRHVRSETRRRVLEAIERLEFRPNRTARGLVKGATQTIGVLVPFFTKHYFLEVLRGIEQSTSASDYSLIVYNVEQREQARSHLDFLGKARRVDALIVIALDGALVDEAYGGPAPYPIVGVDTQIPGGTNLLPDHERGLYLAVGHLAGLGHRRIALIDRPQDPVSGTVSGTRRRGYRKACREAGLTVPPSYVVVAEYSVEGGRGAARRLLGLPSPPTALACGSDLQAIGALRAVQELGLVAGVDVSVIGYHDVELAQYVGLTTVRVPASDMGRAAVQRLVAMLKGEAADGQPHLFSPELAVRDTCGPCLDRAAT